MVVSPGGRGGRRGGRRRHHGFVTRAEMWEMVGDAAAPCFLDAVLRLTFHRRRCIQRSRQVVLE